MAFIRSFIVSCGISQRVRQFSSSLSVLNDKQSNRLPRGYRPVNAYAVYCQEFLKEKREKSVTEAMSAAAQQWKNLDENTKSSYKQKSKEIEEERKAAFEGLPVEKKEELQQIELKTLDRRQRIKRRIALREKAEKSGRPKAPLNFYAAYIKESYQHISKPSSLSESREILVQAAEKWKSMSEDEKKKYEDQVAPARKEYEKAMDVWKAAQNKAHNKEMESRKKQREREKLAHAEAKLAKNVVKKPKVEEVKDKKTEVADGSASPTTKRKVAKDAVSSQKKPTDVKPSKN